MSAPSSNAIHHSMRKGLEWIWEARNKDHGWGGKKASKSILLDTCETLSGLLRAGIKRDTRVNQTYNYISRMIGNIPKDEKELITSKTYSWCLRALSDLGIKTNSHEVLKSNSELEPFRVKGKGWSTVIGDDSEVFNTCIAVSGLSGLKILHQQVTETISWLKSIQNKDGGWGFFEGYKSNAQCTALVLSTLIETGEKENKIIRKASEWLISHQKNAGNWSLCPEPEQESPIVNHVYVHYSTPWAVTALLDSGVESSHEAIPKAIKFMLKLQSEDGAWPITQYLYLCEGKISPFTFATAYSLMALHKYTNS